jgi:DNA-binding MarR family transcriptional regulator
MRELEPALGRSATTIRRHIAALEQEGAIRGRRDQQSRAHHFELTEQARGSPGQWLL